MKNINWNLIAIVIIGGILIWLQMRKPTDVVKETVITEKVDIEKKITEAVNNALINQKPPQQYFTIKTDPGTGKQTVINVQPGTEGAIQANVYKDTTKVDGGVIYSEIAAEGRVLQNKVRVPYFIIYCI